MLRLLTLLALAGFTIPLGAPALRAQAEPAGQTRPPKAAPRPEDYNLHIEILVVQIPKTAEAKLLPQLHDPKQIDAAYATLLEMAASERARIVGWPVVIARSGERSISEEADEVRYATSFEAGRTVTEKPIDAAAQAAPEAGGEKAAEPKKAETALETVTFDAIPEAFETRNAGFSLEIVPTLDDTGNRIEAGLAFGHTHFGGMEKVVIESESRKITVEQPRFRCARINTVLKTRSGQRVLLGSFPAPDQAAGQPPQVELFLYRATAELVPK